MFIKQKQVRRSKFTSRFAGSARKRREYAASVYSMGVIQGFLIIFLVIGALRSYEVMREKFPDLPWYAQLGVPAVMVLIGLLVLKAFVSNLRHAVELSRDQRSPAEDRLSRDKRGAGDAGGTGGSRRQDGAGRSNNRSSGTGDGVDRGRGASARNGKR